MASLVPVLTSSPFNPSTYNFGMAETFSWIPIQTPLRPLYAKSVFSVNNKDNEGANGFDFLQPGTLYKNDYVCIQTVASTTFAELTADNSTYGAALPAPAGSSLFNTTFPANFKLRGKISAIKLATGSAIGYK